ncbi:unnamed protein product [Lupinus luteus]|uniref:superoxide dismutase n=1 Tax=Lupinus luteus TaxID=3873 RepID=A0AAV1W1X4_LUPLU
MKSLLPSTTSLLPPPSAFLPHQSHGFLHMASPTSFNFSNKERRSLSDDGPIETAPKIELKPPPYPLNALEPIISQKTLEYHWGKHHRAYVDNLNKQIAGTDLEGKSLEEIIVTSYNKGDILPAFNNAAQAWNHEFYWESIKPGGGGKPSGDLLKQIERDFGSFEKLIDELKIAATTQFGSGWAWLAYKENRLDVGNAVNPLASEADKKLVVVKSPNAVNPLVWGYYPILTIDVWEHAYYLDFQNRRPDYISNFIEKLVSWEAVSSRLEQAKVLIAEKEKEDERKKREEEEELLTGGSRSQTYRYSDAEGIIE